jgi:hypothetical protein
MLVYTGKSMDKRGNAAHIFLINNGVGGIQYNITTNLSL